ncbi:uncharacterized protein LOC106651728 [Trichogramma pretiosum]|uniref:uncharacterized protein LOC106651728 n=1 Tax=Trichogramma pretiosum TaxID=7493 RepID=UPI0006C97540|nr:uncharacterized protein LOC106651728 [Trichogramma pretiosum]
MIFTVCLALLAIGGIGSGSSIYNATSELNVLSNELHTRAVWPRLAYGRKVNIDKMFDENLKTIQSLVAYYADPGKLRDMQIPINHIAETFGYYIYLTNGSLQNLSWLERAGTCTLAYRNKVLTVDLIMSFESLSFDYDYRYPGVLATYEGLFYGFVRDVKMNMVLDIDFDKYEMVLKNLDYLRAGKIDLHIKGGYYSWFVNWGFKLVSHFCHDLVLERISVYSSYLMEGQMNELNEQLGQGHRKFVFIDKTKNSHKNFFQTLTSHLFG